MLFAAAAANFVLVLVEWFAVVFASRRGSGRGGL